MTSPEVGFRLQDLVHRYAAYVDERDWAAATALFTEDGVLVTPEPVERHEGHAEIRQAFAALERVLLTCHEVGAVVLEHDGASDTATGRVSCAAHHVTRSGEALRSTVWHLHYVDEYRRTGATWLIAGRELVLDLVETRSVDRARGV